MTIPCLKSESRCSPCADGNPFANLSIEPFDLDVFPCVFFHEAVNVTPNVWEKSRCVGFSESPTSLTDACDRAAVIARSCPPPPPPFPPPPLPPLPPPSHNYTFCNDEVTCQSGSNCYTLPACTVVGTSKADANAIAQSLCNSRVLDSGLTGPCAPLPPGPAPEPPVDPGPTITYEKAWNTISPTQSSGRGEWFIGYPCPWPDDFIAAPSFACLCDGDDSDPYQWPFGAGSPVDPDSIVTQLGISLDAVLDSYVLPNTPDYENRGTVERLYLRTRIEGGATGKHVVMQGHWTKPGGAWVERYWNGDNLAFDDLAVESYLKLEFNYDPCIIYEFSGTPQVLEISAIPASGDVTYEFDVPAGETYYACIWFESRTHSNGPSTLHMTTTIT